METEFRVMRDGSGRFLPGHPSYRRGGRPPADPRLARVNAVLAGVTLQGRERKADPPPALVTRDLFGQLSKVMRRTAMVVGARSSKGCETICAAR